MSKGLKGFKLFEGFKLGEIQEEFLLRNQLFHLISQTIPFSNNWVQFEGYLPDNTHAYDYRVTKSVDIGGLDFIADAYARNIRANPGRPDSDGAATRNFLAQRGYRLGSDEIIFQRLVHLIGADKRNELMIIYLEDMSGWGLTSADLADGGKAAGKRNEIFEALMGRAIKDMKISR